MQDSSVPRDLARHGDLLAGLLIGAGIALFLLAALGYVASRRRRAEPPFVAWVAALALLEIAHAAPYLAADAHIAAMLTDLAAASRAATATLLASYVAQQHGKRGPGPAVRSVIVGAGVLCVCGAGLEVLAALPEPRFVYETALAGALHVREIALHATGALVASEVVSVAAAGATIVLGARSLLRAGPTTPPVFLCFVALAAANVHDGVRDLGWLRGSPISPLAYDVLVIAVLASLLMRRDAQQRRLEERASELTQKERALVRAYEELSQAQSELVRKEQLAAVGELSAVIAHEVRNPLAIMSNAIATLRREGLRAEDRATLLAILEEEASRLNRLVGDLLRYARPVSLERQSIGVRALVERATAIVRSRTDVTVEIVEEEPLAKIQGDPNLLRQVLENLISNAMQAMQAGGVLSVRLRPAEIDGEPGVEIQIEDTGEGMDTAVRRRALDPFFTTRPSGTGLGLAIVARIVDAHGGRIKITSAAGAGTLVHVYLPCSGDSKMPRISSPGRATPVPPLSIEPRAKSTGGGAR